MTRYIAAYANEIAGFIKAVNSGGTTPTTGEDGLRALVLADAALKSAESGRAVNVSEILG
jgi:myo-inositol 2-dehydrogenase/D-chiro-inositol 1-dehydrogenase